MNIQEIISKKRDNKILTNDEIKYFITEYVLRYSHGLSGGSSGYGYVYKWTKQ